MSFLHSVALAVMGFFVLYTAVEVVILICSFFKNIFSRPKNFLRTLKRAVLRPSYFFKQSLRHFSLSPASVRCIYAVVALALSVLCGLEIYRYSGADLVPGSYTEYPYAKAGYYVLVHRDGEGIKYYELPAQIIRNSETGEHALIRVWWPNGGYLTFGSPDDLESAPALKVGKSVYALDFSKDDKYDLILTTDPCSRSQITATEPEFTWIMGLFCLSFVYLLVGLFPFKFPLYLYPDNKAKTEYPA